MLENRLRIFLAVCEYGTMTAAAEALYMTQSAVSQAIAALEEYYGVPLFNRFPRRLELTTAGLALKGAAQDILQRIEETDSLIRSAEETGPVRIGANLSVGEGLIHGFLKDFREAYPDAEVEVTATRGSALRKMLDQGALDFLLMEELEGEDYEQEAFYSDRIVMVTAPGHPLLERAHLCLKDLKDEPFFLREKGAGVRRQFDHLCQAHGMNVRCTWESSSTTILVNALESGENGIAVLPYLLVKDELDSGRIRELSPEDVSLDRTLYIIRHRGRYLSKAAQAFIDIVREKADMPAD